MGVFKVCNLITWPNFLHHSLLRELSAILHFTKWQVGILKKVESVFSNFTNREKYLMQNMKQELKYIELKSGYNDDGPALHCVIDDNGRGLQSAEDHSLTRSVWKY